MLAELGLDVTPLEDERSDPARLARPTEALAGQDVDLSIIAGGMQATWANLMRAGLTPSEVQVSRQFVADRLLAQGTPEATVQFILP